MDDFDFTKPQPALPAAPPALFKPTVSKFYDAATAMRFFQQSGKSERFAAGATVFTENEKSGKAGLFGKKVVHRMYLLTEGEVALSAGNKPLDTVRAGEIFGEMAVIGDAPTAPSTPSVRSATATAKTDCTGFSLDVDEFQVALQQMPEFALMLMSIMFDRLRFLGARLAVRKTALSSTATMRSQIFGPAMLEHLQNQLDQATTIRYQQDKIIMREGEMGTIMYVVLEGSVSISIANKIVEVINEGGTFGEMALVDQSPRTASAVAQTDCVLLAVTRNALIALVKAEPAFGVALLKGVAERLRYMNSLLG